MKKIYFLFALIFSWCLGISQTPDWLWARSAGGSADLNIAYSISTMQNGTSYVTGYFQDSVITFGSWQLLNDSVGTDDIFIVKYNADGNVIWAKRFGGNYYDIGYSIFADEKGSIYLTGAFNSTQLIFGTDTLTCVDSTTIDVFIAKLDSTGNAIWAVSAGNQGYEISRDIAVNNEGQVFITGYFQTPSLIIGIDTLLNFGVKNFFIAKYDSSGHVLWARTEDSGKSESEALGVAIDSSGNSYVTGDFDWLHFVLGVDTFFSAGSHNYFLIKYDSNGNKVWGRNVDGCSFGNAVATDMQGNIIVSGGSCASQLHFGTYTLSTGGIFTVKYDNNGNVLWAKSPANGDPWCESICTDAQNNVYITGAYSTLNLTFGTHTLTNSSPGISEIFLAKYNSTGMVMWAKSAGGSFQDWSNGVSSDSIGNAFIVGSFNSPSIDFGSNLLINVSTNSTDLFIAKLDNAAGVIGKPGEQFNTTIFPNPATSTINIIVEKPLNNIAHISIFNSLGAMVLQQSVSKGTQSITLNIENLSPGLYYLNMGGYSGKFVKQ